MVIISRRKNLNQLVNYQKCAHKLSWNACTWHELADQTFDGQWMDTSLSQTFGRINLIHPSHKWLPSILSCEKHSSALSVRFTPRLRFCWWPWGLQINVWMVYYVSLEVEHLCQSVGCARSKRQYPTILQNLKLFRWMLDCEWTDHLLSIYGIWWWKCYVRQTTPEHQLTLHLETDVRRQWIRETHPKVNRRETEMFTNCCIWIMFLRTHIHLKASYQNDYQRHRSNNETRVKNPLSCNWLVVWQNHLELKNPNQIRWHQEPTCRH